MPHIDNNICTKKAVPQMVCPRLTAILAPRLGYPGLVPR